MRQSYDRHADLRVRIAAHEQTHNWSTGATQVQVHRFKKGTV